MNSDHQPPPMPGPDSEPALGYVLSYFTAEREGLHLAVSRDGRQWRPLNGERPVLMSTLGSRSLRDPYIGQAADGTFHLLATDGWSSTGILHSVSDDLVHWRSPTLVPVMAGVAGARNAWAPEFFWDAAEGRYRAIWSSSIDPREVAAWGETAKDTTMEHRIWSALTPDFEHWSEASVFFDPGYTVIDASVLADGGGYLMAFKDERGDNHANAVRKGIRTVTYRGAGEFAEPSELVTDVPAEGPTLFRTTAGLVMLFDRFLDGAYGAICSADGVRWAPFDGFAPPPGVRHGAVLPVSLERLHALELALGSA